MLSRTVVLYSLFGAGLHALFSPEGKGQDRNELGLESLSSTDDRLCGNGGQDAVINIFNLQNPGDEPDFCLIGHSGPKFCRQRPSFSISVWRRAPRPHGSRGNRIRPWLTGPLTLGAGNRIRRLNISSGINKPSASFCLPLTSMENHPVRPQQFMEGD